MASFLIDQPIRKNSGHMPIYESGGSFYQLLYQDSTTNSLMRMYKTYDPTSRDWEIIDSAGAPTSTYSSSGGGFTTTCIDSSGVIHIWALRYNLTPDLWQHERFDTTTDQWVTSGTTRETISQTGYVTCSVTQRGNGDLVFFFNGIADDVGGDSKFRVDYSISTDGGDTWGAITAVDDAGDIHYTTASVCVNGSQSTDVHLVYQRATNTAFDPPTQSITDLQGKTLSGTSLSTAVTLTNVASLRHVRGLNNGIGFDNSGTWRVIICGVYDNGLDDTELMHSYFDENVSNDLGSGTGLRTIISPLPETPIAETGNCQVIRSHDGTIYYWYTAQGTDDLNYVTSSDNGASLDSTNGIEPNDSVVTGQYIDISEFNSGPYQKQPFLTYVTTTDCRAALLPTELNAYGRNDNVNRVQVPITMSGQAGAGTALSITVVDGDDSWVDGNNSITATGTGFYTAP